MSGFAAQGALLQPLQIEFTAYLVTHKGFMQTAALGRVRVSASQS